MVLTFFEDYCLQFGFVELFVQARTHEFIWQLIQWQTVVQKHKFSILKILIVVLIFDAFIFKRRLIELYTKL